MTQRCNGWILDVYIENDEAVLWIKTEDRQALRLIDNYEPAFYIQPKDEKSGIELYKILSELELVKEVSWSSKLTDINSNVQQKMLTVRCYLIPHYNLLLKTIQHEIFQQRINQLFNTRLTHIQRYLFSQLRIQPSSKVNIEYENGELVSISKVSDGEDLQLPFSIMNVEVIPFTEQEILDKDDSIKIIRVRYESNEIILEDDESTVLQEFFHYVKAKDPDIIIFANHDLNILHYLFERMKLLSLDLELGRQMVDIYSTNEPGALERWCQGRLYLPNQENRLGGLIELSRFCCLPMKMILRHSIGRMIANRILYELMGRGYIISDKYTQTHEKIRTVEEIIDRDKAGMIFSPQIGLHENVAVLDYNDEFANIIVNNNISYETVSSAQQDRSQLGLLPNIVKKLLERRSYFKELMKQLPNESAEENSCKERADTIKKILVCLYGTTASFWNRYGNVVAFEEINKKSRDILLKTKDIVQGLGYDLIYSDTDASFVHKDNATRGEYEKLVKIISEETGLALSLEYHYKFLVLLPLEADEKLEALKHYFGITRDGELVTRGIEIRRHDTPRFIKDFQTELLYTLFDAENTREIIERTLEDALFFVTKTIDKIMTGEIETKDLVISKQLRMDITKYKNIFPHVAAAIQLSNTSGKQPSRGDVVQFVYTNSEHQNPLNRVTSVEPSCNNSGLEYDRTKYQEMLLDAAETTLGIFGFDRTLFGKPKDKKWWMQLRRNNMNDVQAEVGGT